MNSGKAQAESAGRFYSAVVAMASNRSIGKDGQLPWHIPGELKWFKELTIGHPIVMGRKTFDSIGKALPGRRNIVFSQSLHQGDVPGVEIINSLADLEALALEGEVFIIGGTRVFELLLDRTDTIYLTYIYQSHEGDTFFPAFEDDFSRPEVVREKPEYEVRIYRRNEKL